MKIILQKSIFSYLNFISIFTAFNLVGGLACIYLSINSHYYLAGFILIACVVLDTLDGFFACRFGLETDFGAEYDSLADLVSFGVAPMVLVMLYFDSFWLSIVSMLIPMLGALRLSRHNVTREHLNGSLIGLPIGSSGIIIPVLVFFDANIIVASFTIFALACLYLATFTFKKITH